MLLLLRSSTLARSLVGTCFTSVTSRRRRPPRTRWTRKGAGCKILVYDGSGGAFAGSPLAIGNGTFGSRAAAGRYRVVDFRPQACKCEGEGRGHVWRLACDEAFADGVRMRGVHSPPHPRRQPSRSTRS